jgi:hypothetical protein
MFSCIYVTIHYYTNEVSLFLRIIPTAPSGRLNAVALTNNQFLYLDASEA